MCFLSCVRGVEEMALKPYLQNIGNKSVVTELIYSQLQELWILNLQGSLDASS